MSRMAKPICCCSYHRSSRVWWYDQRCLYERLRQIYRYRWADNRNRKCDSATFSCDLNRRTSREKIQTSMQLTVIDVYANSTRIRLYRFIAGCRHGWHRWVFNSNRIKAKSDGRRTRCACLNDSFGSTFTTAYAEKQAKQELWNMQDAPARSNEKYPSAWNIASIGCLAMNSTWCTKWTTKSFKPDG